MCEVIDGQVHTMKAADETTQARIVELLLLLKPQPCIEVKPNQCDIDVVLLDVRWPKMKERELFLMKGLAQGKPVKVIARELKVSRRTVYRLLQGLKENLGVDTSMELVAQAVRLGLIE